MITNDTPIRRLIVSVVGEDLETNFQRKVQEARHLTGVKVSLDII